MRTTLHDRHRCTQNTDHLAHNTPIFSVFHRGGLHFGEHTDPRRSLTTTKRGNDVIRDPTRRRHADSQLLMLPNPTTDVEMSRGSEDSTSSGGFNPIRRG